MGSPQRHLITCALPYANGPIHIGHLAGCLLPSDIYARYLRMKGKDILFVSGTDEHGVPITLKARKEHTTPQHVVDQYYDLIKNALTEFGIQFDNFSRTSRPVHHEMARDFFLKLLEKGVFTVDTTEQYFDKEANQFLADRYITGTCPNCGNENAYGDQCEKCGTSLSPRELINPRSALTGNAPVLKETKNWFLPLDRIQESFLNEFIDSHKADWKSHVYGQCMSWLNDGLRPRAMTRDLDWGIPVPVEGAEGKVMYVWFDAPIGYISATKEITPDWEKWWKDERTELTHFIGKDNIVFHCLIFPAMLHEHGDFILPKNVPANEFLNLEGDKISTSRDHAVWLHEYLREMPGREDELRYVLTSISPETKDADFSWKDYQARVNNELVAILGNWVNRVVVLTQKYFDGAIQEYDPGKYEEVFAEANEYVRSADESAENFRFKEAQAQLLNIARLGNRFLQETEPWKLIKENPEETGTILRASAELMLMFADQIMPFLPRTGERIREMMNLSKGDKINAGQIMNTGELLFTKVEDDIIEVQLNKLKKEEKMEDKNEQTIKPEIVYDDFAKLDLRVGTITEAEKVEKADRLLKLTVDLGFEVRTIVSGIAEHFTPEEAKGQHVVVVANLAPRKLRGIESNGMILMAEDSSGKLKFVAPTGGADNGSPVT